MAAEPFDPGFTRGRASGFSYIPELDGIRAVCIVLVITGHLGFGNELPGAALGVTIFFFLSGYLITSLAISEMLRTNSFSLRSFYLRRARRLIPAVVVMVVTVCTADWIINGRFRIEEFLPAILYLANYYKVLFGFTLPLSPLWSLAVEEHFYLLFPLLFIIAMKRDKLRSLSIIVSAVIIASLLVRLVLVIGFDVGYEYTARTTECRMDSIAFGAMLAIILNSHLAERWLSACRNPLVISCSIALLAVSFLIDAPILRNTLKYTEQGIALAILVTSLFACSYLGIARAVLSLKPLRWIGQLSYSLYLWHSPAIIFAGSVSRGFPPLIKIVLGLVFSLIAAAASFYLVERQFYRVGHRRKTEAAKATMPADIATQSHG